MGKTRRVSATLAGASGTAFTEVVDGFLDTASYIYVDQATGLDITVTDEETGAALLTITNAGTANAQWRPRVGAHPVANTGAGTIIAGDATAGGAGVATEKLLVNGRIKVVWAQGTSAKTGRIYFDVRVDD